MRPLGAGEARFDRRDIEFQRCGVARFRAAGRAPQALCLGILFHEVDVGFFATGGAQIGERFVIHWEESAGRAVFRCHVGNGRAVGERQLIEARAIELDELPDDALFAQHLRNSEHKVCRGRAFFGFAAEAKAHDFGYQHRNRLAQHRGFGFDTTDAPTEDGHAVDHGGVTVGADERVGISDGLAADFVGPDDAGEVFQIYLMTDSDAGRDHAKVIERARAPTQKLVAFHIAFIFELDVFLERRGGAKRIDHHRMIDHQIDGRERVDRGRIAARLGDRVAHGRQIDDGGHAGEILHQHAGRAIGDLARVFAPLEPGGHGFDVGHFDGSPVLVAQKVLEQHPERQRQRGEIEVERFFRRLDAEVVVAAVADLEGPPRFEGIPSDRRHYVPPGRKLWGERAFRRATGAVYHAARGNSTRRARSVGDAPMTTPAPGP